MNKIVFSAIFLVVLAVGQYANLGKEAKAAAHSLTQQGYYALEAEEGTFFGKPSDGTSWEIIALEKSPLGVSRIRWTRELPETPEGADYCSKTGKRYQPAVSFKDGKLVATAWWVE